MLKIGRSVGQYSVKAKTFTFLLYLSLAISKSKTFSEVQPCFRYTFQNYLHLPRFGSDLLFYEVYELDWKGTYCSETV